MEGNERTLTHDLAEGFGTRRTSRKRFLAEAAGFTGALVAAGLARPEAANAAAVRGFTAGTFFLELSKGSGGFVESGAGGNITADAVDRQPTAPVLPEPSRLAKFVGLRGQAGG